MIETTELGTWQLSRQETKSKKRTDIRETKSGGESGVDGATRQKFSVWGKVLGWTTLGPLERIERANVKKICQLTLD